ncbi:MAG: TonB-dependent receptor [Bacteroidetes bacterium]|nr:TonB-dependent receptor [Bacteroidota bacterium]
MLKRLMLMVVSAAMLLPATSYADVTGKVSGTVTDKKTGEPLELANVVLVSTQFGASTNRQGRFNILNVPVGVYDIKFAYLGYKPVVVKGVRVVPDNTVTVDMQLQELDLEVDEIVVQATRPLFEKGATNSVRVIEKEQIANLPTRGVQNIASLTAGVVKTDNSGGETRNATLNIRGGRGNETAYIIDGVMVNDNAGGGASGQLAQSAIDQISLQVGGFEAKYGKAMSGIVNTVTKTGTDRYNFGGEVITSEFTDNFGYNLYAVNASGPIPLIPNLSFFTSYERTWLKDTNPRYSTDEARKDMEGGVHKYSGKLNWNLSNTWRFTTSMHGSYRQDRNYVHLYSKNNSSHNPRVVENQWLANQRISYTLNEYTFMNLDFHYRFQEAARGDGVWFDKLDAYGDTTMALLNPRLTTGVHPAQGGNYGLDENLVFNERGRINNGYVLSSDDYMGTAFSITSQLSNHLVEAGFDWQMHTFRTFGVGPAGLAIEKDTKSPELRFYEQFGRAVGYDIAGSRSDKGDGVTTFNPLYPIMASAYIQDKIELKDLIFNAGLRMDYFNPNGKQVKNVNLPLGADNKLDAGDLEDQEVFIFFSPRLGIAFPVTESMKFHAQYGRFIASPPFFDVYAFESRLRLLENDAALEANNGNVKPENTIQYEAGINYAFGTLASIDMTVFYKEVRDLVNETIFNSPKGQYYSTSNIDFATVRGISLATNTRRIADYFQLSANYLYQIAEGTGSTSNSNFVAAFRSNIIPRQVNLLDFDQRHTFTASVDARTKNNDGPEVAGMYPLSRLGANLVITFSSGRPYTPIVPYDVYNGGGAPITRTLGTVNSAVGPSTFRVDAKFDKTIGLDIGTNKLNLNFYVWVINLLDNANAVTIYRATGSAEDTGFLQTPEGRLAVANNPNYETDYRRWERDPENYGAARQIRLGMRFDL